MHPYTPVKSPSNIGTVLQYQARLRRMMNKLFSHRYMYTSANYDDHAGEQRLNHAKQMTIPYPLKLKALIYYSSPTPKIENTTVEFSCI